MRVLGGGSVLVELLNILENPGNRRDGDAVLLSWLGLRDQILLVFLF